MSLLRKCSIWKLTCLFLAAFLLSACSNDGAGTDLPTNTSGFLALNYGIVITSDKTQVTADGTSTANVTVTLIDSDRGMLVGEGTRVTFSTNLGSIPPLGITSAESEATATILSSTPGSATVTATAPDGTSASINITFI